VVTGPTGSGKSTTLAGMVNHKNESELGHILTIEDPIEFVHQSKKCLINQREVHRDTHSFSDALRSALREDPDTIVAAHEIMIGTPAIRNLIREDKVAQMYSAIQTGQQVGMQTLDQCLKTLVQNGDVEVADARRKATNPDIVAAA